MFFFSIFKVEKCRLVIMDNGWKFHCRVTKIKPYRVVEILNVSCMLKAEFL